MKYLLEICANSVQSARNAQSGGALIRPRAGSFCYTPAEVEEMAQDIEFCAAQGVDGVVIGCLDKNNQIDWTAICTLANAAQGMALTFHRAFDFIPDPIAQLTPLAALHFENILTTGAADKAIDGLTNLSEYIKQDHGIHIMPGGGVNASNILAFARAGATRFHLSGKKAIPNQQSIPTAFGTQYETDTSTVRNIKSILADYFA